MGRTGVRFAASGLSALLLVGVVNVLPAYGQNRFAGMSPQALLQAWQVSPKADRPLIAEAMLDDRAAVADALRAALIGGNTEAKVFACSMLGQMRDAASVPVLLAATADADERVQARAVSALRTIGDPGAAPRVRQLVTSTRSTAVLKRSLVALGKFGAPADIALIRPMLSHPDESVRVIAAGALAMLGNIEGQDFLFAAVDGSNPIAQKNATVALGYLPTAEAASKLAAILADPNGRWKSYAVIAQAQRARRGQAPQAEAATLEGVARGRDRLAAVWALDELTELPTPDATLALQRLGARPGFRGEAARIRLKVKEGL